VEIKEAVYKIAKPENKAKTILDANQNLEPE
jgi:hypothetical protein